MLSLFSHPVNRDGGISSIARGRVHDWKMFATNLEPTRFIASSTKGKPT